MTSSVALIPARGGSRRIPRKNVRPFLGTPAIERVIATLQRAEIFDQILVSTDDAQIAQISRSAGADVPALRPAALSDDHTTTAEVLRHAIDVWLPHLHEDALLWGVYPTAVLLKPQTVIEAQAAFLRARPDYLVPVLRYPHPVERRMRVDQSGFLYPDEPTALAMRSQDLVPAFHDAGQFYLGTIQAWKQFVPLASGRNLAFELPAGSAIDVDEPRDWTLAEMLAQLGDS